MNSRHFQFDFVPYTCGSVAFPEAWHIFCQFKITTDNTMVKVRAPRTDAPQPPGNSGRFPQLWRYDVVELFLLGENERYVELEFGPFGHYWFLQLKGCRQIVGEIEPLMHECKHTEDTWEAGACLPPLDFQPHACNVTCILSTQRFHGSLVELPGEIPNFHQLKYFFPLPSR